MSESFLIINQTAKTNGLNIEEYLTCVTENISKIDANELLPSSTTLSNYLKEFYKMHIF